ncbi:MAG: hypothetical protein LUQ16_03435 [Methanomassiliicoccales archaeon]|jgi:hypothetical protein|nr:hypothetical protein [Methanomassiliicoccales archaeon]
MPHCKVCGNPVSKTDTECRLCGAALIPGYKRGQTSNDYVPSPGSGSEGTTHEKDSPSRWETSAPYQAPKEESRVWSPQKIIAVVVAAAILLPIFAYFVSALIGAGPPSFILTTPTGQFMWVAHEDNRTIRGTFDDFDPDTRFSDCAYRVQIGAWTSSTEEVVANWYFNVTSPDYSMVVYFADLDMNGIIEAGDYCNISSMDVPLGLQCSIEILFEPTGGSICSTQFAFL